MAEIGAMDDSELCHTALAVLGAISRDAQDGGFIELTEHGELVVDIRTSVPTDEREIVERFLRLYCGH